MAVEAEEAGPAEVVVAGVSLIFVGVAWYPGKLSRSAEEMENVVGVPPSGGDGSQNVYAVVDECEPVAQAEAPLDVTLDG